ncbi:MAG: MaoC family dehydratase [Dehalococcoidales bacterium]|nr:MaoC family dehydratase [Dehalococcoidales bacterium]
MLTKDSKAGYEITGNRKNVTEQRVFLFSGGFPKGDDWPKINIHTDLEFAKNCGLSDRAASGATFEGYLTELMINNFGENWLNHGKMHLKFIRIVAPGDTLLPKAVITSVVEKDGETEISLDVWCQNQNKEKVVIGTAMGRIR